MTVDTYHTLIGAIFVLMMAGFLFFGGRNVLVNLLISALVSVGFAGMIRRGYDFLIGIDWQSICFDIKSSFIELYHFAKIIVMFVIIILVAVLMLRTFYHGIIGRDNEQSKEE